MGEVFLNGLGEMLGVYSPRVVVFFDIDKTIRWGKEPPNRETVDAIIEFQKNGGLAIPITGGPLVHVPVVLRENLPLVFAESGSAGLVNGKEKVFVTAGQLGAIERFLQAFFIRENNGYAFMSGHKIILEGPRKASITLVTGKHPDYPRPVETPIEAVRALARSFVKEHRLPLTTSSGVSATYAWEDVTTLGKEHMVAALRKLLENASVYFIGDGLNDLQSMLQPGVIPVAVGNSIAPIQSRAEQKGIQISLDGPDGGVVQALQYIQYIQ